MAFLVKHCLSISSRRSLYEINRLKYVLSETSPGVVANKKHIAAVQRRYFATENDVECDKEKLETEQVYYGPLTRQIRSIKAVTIATSVVGLLSQPMLYSKIQEVGPTGAMIAACSFYGFFTLVSPYLIHLVTKRYVTQIEYNPKADNYIAYRYTFFLRRKKIEFTPDDVKVPTMSGMFTTVDIKGSPLFMDVKFFQDPSHYGKIMGYDKPIDFSIESDSEEQKK